MAATRTRRKPAAKPALRMSALLGLQKVDLFKGLDSYTLREIAAQCKWARCKRNQVVIHHDGADRDVYFVIAGQVRVTAQAGRGRRIIFRELAAGEVFGEHSAIDGRARFADALALRETLLASMSPEAFRAILANHASVRERLLRRLTGSVRELAGRLLELGAQPVQRRTWVELLRLARRRRHRREPRAARSGADAQRYRQPGGHLARADHARAVAPGARGTARARRPRPGAARRRRAGAARGRCAPGSRGCCRLR